MNETSPIQQSTHPPITIILIIGATFVLLILALNYFDILPISNLSPIQKAQPTPTIGKTIPTSAPFKISCPSIKEFCEEGKGIINDQGYIGLGYKLSSGSAIFAVFDGDLTATKSAFSTEIDGKTVKVKFRTVYIDNLNLRATYFFKGDIIKSGKVNKGEQIAITNGKPIVIYDNNSLIFSLSESHTAATITINKEYFE